MKTADYKRAAVKIQSELAGLHFMRAEQWSKLGKAKEHAYSVRDGSHALARAMILENPKHTAAAGKIARMGNFAVAMTEAKTAAEKLKASLDFINEEVGIEMREKNVRSSFKPAQLGGIIHRNYQPESEEQHRKRMELYKSIFEK